MDGIPLVILLGFLMILLFLSHLFSGTEMAFISTPHPEIDYAFRDSVLKKAVRFFLRSPHLMLMTILIGNNLALVAFSLLWEHLLANYLAPHWYDRMDEVGKLLMETLTAALIVVTLGEYLPKQLGYAYSWRWLRAVAPLLMPVFLLLSPLLLMVVGLERIWKRIRGKEISPARQVFSRADVEWWIFRSVCRPDSLKQQKQYTKFQELVSRLSRFVQERVRDVLTPRPELVAVNIHDSMDTLRATFTRSRKSRVLVYEDSLDQIRGYVYLYDMIGMQASGSSRKISSLLREISTLTESTPLLKALDILLQQRTGIGWVVDEYGSTAGVITLKDLVRTMAGYADDQERRYPAYYQISATEYEVEGRARIEDLNREAGLQFPEDPDYETFNGYVLSRIGRFPREGETFVLDDRFEIRILRATPRQILRARIQILEP